MNALPDGRHFVYADLRCHDGTPYPLIWPDRYALTMGLIDDCRDVWDAPLWAVSGYRSPAFNAFLVAADAAAGRHGAVSGSEHVEGRAVDLRPLRHEDVRALHGALFQAYQARRLPTLGGLGIYEDSGWVHVDTFKAADGHLRQWVGT